MNMRLNASQQPPFVVAGYVRRSSYLQKDNYSIDAQQRGIIDEAARRNLAAPVFYMDDERSARSEQIAKRPAFRRLLDDIEAGRVHIVMVHTLDRWSRNVMVTLQSFRILAEKRTSFISVSEHIDYSTPEGKLQLTILAAFAAYFSDMLSKHASKGKGERAAQGLHNGDAPYGYRRVGPKTPLEHHPDTYPGLRMIGELRMTGMTSEKIADTVNAAGYRTGSKRYGNRLFTKATITSMVHNEFYAAFAPGDDRGTITYRGQRYRGLHPAAFTYEEWERIQAGTRLNYRAPQRTEQAQRVYEFAGYVADIQCGLTLRCHHSKKNSFYRDVAKTRRQPCPAGGYRLVKADLVRRQFGELLGSLKLPTSWREEIHHKMQEIAKAAGINSASIEREKERLKLKRTRILRQYREGYLDDIEYQSELAAVELALHSIEMPEMNGVKLDDIIAAGERLPGITALWEVATPEERRELVTLLLEPGGLYYDLELRMIAAIKPRPVFLPTLRLLEGTIEYQEAQGVLVITGWQEITPRK
jgi:site-specific DNA recombinase